MNSHQREALQTKMNLTHAGGSSDGAGSFKFTNTGVALEPPSEVRTGTSCAPEACASSLEPGNSSEEVVGESPVGVSASGIDRARLLDPRREPILWRRRRVLLRSDESCSEARLASFAADVDGSLGEVQYSCHDSPSPYEVGCWVTLGEAYLVSGAAMSGDSSTRVRRASISNGVQSRSPGESRSRERLFEIISRVPARSSACVPPSLPRRVEAGQRHGIC